jgi:hypothetical protein
VGIGRLFVNLIVFTFGHKKSRTLLPGFSYNFLASSGDVDFVCLQALLALHDLEANFLAFGEALEAVALDRAEMHENIRAIVTADEAETLGIVEPLDGTDLTI